MHWQFWMLQNIPITSVVMKSLYSMISDCYARDWFSRSCIASKCWSHIIIDSCAPLTFRLRVRDIFGRFGIFLAIFTAFGLSLANVEQGRLISFALQGLLGSRRNHFFPARKIRLSYIWNTKNIDAHPLSSWLFRHRSMSTTSLLYLLLNLSYFFFTRWHVWE